MGTFPACANCFMGCASKTGEEQKACGRLCAPPEAAGAAHGDTSAVSVCKPVKPSTPAPKECKDSPDAVVQAVSSMPLASRSPRFRAPSRAADDTCMLPCSPSRAANDTCLLRCRWHAYELPFGQELLRGRSAGARRLPLDVRHLQATRVQRLGRRSRAGRLRSLPVGSISSVPSTRYHATVGHARSPEPPTWLLLSFVQPASFRAALLPRTSVRPTRECQKAAPRHAA